MKTNKTSKRALLTSVLSIALCLSMLIGTTFAWFTDTASTAVNKIQAGTLDVDIVDATDNTLNGKTLYFRDKDQNTNILWEPGATFNLDTFRIVNKGNLALKYKVVISGIDGSAELLNVINFTVKKGEEAPVELTGWEGVLLPEGAAPAAGADVKTTGVIAISGKMDEQAGNQYQGLSIDGLGITVYATQANAENDSFGPDYDKDANGNPDHPNWDITANVTTPVVKDEGGAIADTTVANADKTVEVTVPAAAIDPAAENIELTVTPSSTPKVTVTPDQAVKAYDISVTGLAENNETPVEVKLFVGKGLRGVAVAHDGTAIDASKVSYDAATGIVTFSTTSFSPFDVTYELPVATVDSMPYYTLQAAVNAGGNVVLNKDTDITKSGVYVSSTKTVTLDLNGHEIHAANTSKGNIKVYGNLTLKDSVGTGKIWTSNNYVYGTVDKTVIEVSQNGVFTMVSGYIDTANETNPSDTGHFGVGIYENSTVNMQGGTIKSGWYAIAGNGNDNVGVESKINITGGTLISTADYAIYLPQNGTTTISGGVVDGAAGGIQINRGNLVVTGGTIAAQGTGDTGSWGDGTGGTSNAAIHLNAEYGDVTATIDSGATLVANGDAVKVTVANNYHVNLTGTHPDIAGLTK